MNESQFTTPCHHLCRIQKKLGVGARALLFEFKVDYTSRPSTFLGVVLPPFLLAMRGHVHPLDPSWQVAGLGERFPRYDPEVLDAASVVHFSGPAKPWLEISNPEVRSLWTRHVDFSNTLIRKCNIGGVMRDQRPLTS
ncbi:hypothetical protein QQ045_027096 [Rhodiola kirilowii]